MSEIRITAHTRASTDGHRLHVNNYWEPSGDRMVSIRAGHDIQLILPIEDARTLGQAILAATESAAVTW